MATNRIDILKQMVAQDPANSFARYGLAMEYSKAGDHAAAVNEFQDLLKHNPQYAAGYFHGGQALEKLGRVEDARALYEKGVAVTRATGDAHTRAEIEAALALLPV